MKIYMVGIGGVSMSALAKILHYKGFNVSGSDKRKGVFDNELVSLGVNVYYESNLLEVERSDVLIVSNAISSSDVEVLKAQELKIPIYDRASLLKLIIDGYENSIGVAGSHGKTTVTSMLANIFSYAKLNVTAHIGGYDKNFSNLLYNENSKLFITEICEYKKSILKTLVKTAVVTSIDNDHLDCYENFNELKNAFYTFINNASVCFVCGDDVNLSLLNNAIKYGFNKTNNYVAENLIENNGFYTFSVTRNGVFITNITLKVCGKYNVLNSLCAFAVSDYFGVSVNDIKYSLENFTNVNRRYEYLYTVINTPIYADYCHHPSEIEYLIQTAKYSFKNPLFVFEPHTYSRTKILFDNFLKVFKNQNCVFYKTYSARETYSYLGSAEYLARKLEKPFFATFNDLYLYINENACYHDAIFILGAGELYDNFLQNKNR